MAATAGVPMRIATGLTTQIVTKVVTMSEQQADYDTDDTQPTPGPLRTKGLEVVRDDPLRLDEYWVIASFSEVAPQFPHAEGVEPENLGMGSETAKKNAELYAAAGTAASELPEGYDAVASVKKLPRLLDALRVIAGAGGTRYAGMDELQHVAKKALDALRKDTTASDTTQTDE